MHQSCFHVWAYVASALLAVASFVEIEFQAPQDSARARRQGSAASLSDGSLRSAALLRATGEDHAVGAARKAAQSRLVGHFDAVLARLETQTAASLELALDRLQARRGESWTRADREAWRAQLQTARSQNVERLRDYQQRGAFPLNEHLAFQAVPIFVDRHDTACAVGYLMRESGCEEVVDQIAATDLHVYVTDVRSGPLLEWIAYSGLTQEEAALIQPVYEPPNFGALLPELLAGSTIAHQGVRYENFEFESTSVFAGDLPIFLPPGGPGSGIVDPAGLGAAALRGSYFSEDLVEFSPLYNDWLFFGARTDVGQMGTTIADERLAVRFSLSVVSERPGQVISAAELSASPFFNFNYVGGFGGGSEGRIAVATTVRHNGVGLADLALDSDESGFFFLGGSSAAEFLLPIERVDVETTAILSGDAQLTSLNLAFRIVPEPSPLILAALAVGLLAASRSGRAGALSWKLETNLSR